MIYATIIVLTYLFVKYGEPMLDVYNETFRHRQALKIAKTQNKINAHSAELYRRYPELDENYGIQENTIKGFQPED